MGLLHRLRRSALPEPVGGEIAAHGLTAWWLATFTPEERERMVARYGHSEDNTLTGGISGVAYRFDGSTVDATDFLANLAGWFNTPTERDLAKRILVQAEALSGGTRVLTRHFLYSQMIPVFYRDRATDPAALSTAIRACEQQIALAPQAIRAFRDEHEELYRRLADSARRLRRQPEPPAPFRLPSHRGYEQLCIIRDKEGDVAEALRLARQALAQGWAGDWEKRIARYEKKLAKQASA